MSVKEESGKAGLKLNIQGMKFEWCKKQTNKQTNKLNIQKADFMVSIPITSWQIERGKVEAVTDFIFMGS